VPRDCVPSCPRCSVTKMKSNRDEGTVSTTQPSKTIESEMSPSFQAVRQSGVVVIADKPPAHTTYKAASRVRKSEGIHLRGFSSRPLI
jgi:hypothetical protein